MFNCMTIHRCKQRRTRLCLLCMVACVTCILALFVGIGITLGLLLNKGDYAISAYNSVDYIFIVIIIFAKLVVSLFICQHDNGNSSRRISTFLGNWRLTVQSATGHFVWLVRSPGTVSHWTFVPHVPASLTTLTVSHSMNSQLCTAPF